MGVQGLSLPSTPRFNHPTDCLQLPCTKVSSFSVFGPVPFYLPPLPPSSLFFFFFVFFLLFYFSRCSRARRSHGVRAYVLACAPLGRLWTPTPARVLHRLRACKIEKKNMGKTKIQGKTMKKVPLFRRHAENNEGKKPADRNPGRIFFCVTVFEDP